MSKKHLYDPNYLAVAVLAVLLYAGFDKLMANVSSSTARETISAAISVIFVMVTTMYMLKKQTELESSKELNTEVLKKKLYIYTKALTLWQEVGWVKSNEVAEEKKQEAVKVYLELVMVAPDLVAQDASKITSDILGAAEKEDFFGNIGKFAKRARDDLELAKLNTVSVGELDKLLKDITGQAEEQTGRNTDKFEFNGQEYAKSRLVLAVVKEVFRQRNFQTIDDLKEAFPDTWYNNGKSNKWGVVSLKEKIEDPTRWFCKPDDALDLGNKLYAVVRNQWGIDNILYFVKEANKKYNLSIKNIKSQKISHNRD